MYNGRSVTFLTGAIIGNTIDSLKLVLKVCEMKRWKSTVLLLSFLTIVFVGCVAVLLIAGEPREDAEDVPLHPSTSSSYPNSSTKSSRSINVNEEHNEYHNDNHNQHNTHHIDHQPHIHEHRHNYRKRFTDAIKGVFSDLINSTKNSTSSSSTLSSPTFEEHLPRHPTTNKEESTENNSSRLKRQLDFGSSSSEEQKNDGDNSEERYMTTQPSAKKYTPSSRRPFLRVIKTGGGGSTTTSRAAAAASTSSSSPPSLTLLTTSSEENVNSSEEQNSSRGGKFRKNIRRYRPTPGRHPKLQSLSSKEKYDVSQEEQDVPRKNFTLEVVQVERKVVRKEDGNIPPLFKKGSFNIEPRLLKVTKKEDANRPQVVYKKDPKTSASPSIARPSIRKGKSGSREVSKESAPSVESSAEKDGGSSEEKRPVVVNLHQQTPYNDHDLSAEDLKDYHDGHSTFGSKGNFTHTIISRNVAGFLPNESAENLSKRTKSDRKIVIEKGKVTERYPESPFENPSSEIYAVPGGRSSSTETSAPTQEVFPFTRTTKRKGGNGISREVNDNDRTSPAIPSSLAELYRKGHPGVVPAPKQLSHRTHPLSEPYEESAEYSSPFRYDPLVDDPPLKFDPESDRFYGEPVPDNKERVAQSNSPVHVENRDSPEEPPNNEDYFRPKKRESEEDKSQAAAEDDQGSSRETPSRSKPNDGFDYGRAYNPPDYAAEYEADPAGEGGNTRDNDRDNFDFVGLDENFGPGQDATGGVGNDFFDFPESIGGVGGGRGGGSRFKPRTGSDERNDGNGHRNKNEDDTESSNPNGHRDYDEGHRDERPVRRPSPPRHPRGRNPDSDYDANNDYGFGPSPGRNIEDDEAHPDAYDTGFIQTLKQFDEEIKKLQDEERHKLLDSTPHPQDARSTEQERSVEHDQPPPPSTTNGYSKEPPLIITSPGPLEPSFDSPPGPPTPVNGLGGDVGTTIRVAEEEDDDDVTEANPFISSREPTDSREEIIGDTTLPNRSVGAEEDEEDTTTNKGFGPGVPDYSTESSGEVEDEK